MSIRRDEILDNLKTAIPKYDREGVAKWARKAVEEKVNPIKVFNVLTEVMTQVGDRYEQGELWLPDLVGAADAMKSATPILEEEIDRRAIQKETPGVVVAGTVLGDVHNIGITMVCTLLTASGFDVHMLGTDVRSEQFVEAVNQYNPDILAMSALLTTTALEQKKVIEVLNKEGIRNQVKVMVGGGAVTADFAKSIGADGYDPTAPGAVKLAKKLVDQNKGGEKC